MSAISTQSTLSSGIEPTGLREINGVPLYTRAGEPRSRFTLKEELQILGCEASDLEAFTALFAHRRTDFAITRAESGDPSDWVTARGVITLKLIARHLLGDRVPGRKPRWIAPRAWAWTHWVGIDVDFCGSGRDFCRRCDRVERALDILGVPPHARLVVPTPSGGRHYRFFTTRAIATAEIVPTLALVGLTHAKGQIEIFPSETQGMRMPFDMYVRQLPDCEKAAQQRWNAKGGVYFPENSTSCP